MFCFLQEEGTGPEARNSWRALPLNSLGANGCISLGLPYFKKNECVPIFEHKEISHQNLDFWLPLKSQTSPTLDLHSSLVKTGQSW